MNMNTNTKPGNFIIAHFAKLRFWVCETYFTWSFMTAKSNASKAARYMSKLQAFISRFANGVYEWTIYFNDAILKKNQTGIQAYAY